jgi:hypothetical protein
MSWIKSNYHIAALGGGVLVLGGLGYLGYSGNQKVNETLTTSSARKGDTVTTEGGELAEKVKKMVTEPDPIVQRDKEGRPVNLFTSVDLFIRPGNTDDLIDILKEDPIHPPIPNQWWVDHEIDPTPGNAPSLDADADGFTNLEEFQSGTDPQDASSIGDLIAKLEVVKMESDKWKLEFSGGSQTAGAEFSFAFLPYGERVQRNKVPLTARVQPGSLFFSEDPGKERFKLVEIFEHPTEKTTTGQPQLYAKVEDQLENKTGTEYLLALGAKKPEQLRRELNADHKVVFRLNAAGQENDTFKVGENGTFALPPGAAEEAYTLAAVTTDAKGEPVSVTVEYLKDGAKTSIEIPVPPQS